MRLQLRLRLRLRLLGLLCVRLTRAFSGLSVFSRDCAALLDPGMILVLVLVLGTLKLDETLGLADAENRMVLIMKARVGQYRTS